MSAPTCPLSLPSHRPCTTTDAPLRGGSCSLLKSAPVECWQDPTCLLRCWCKGMKLLPSTLPPSLLGGPRPCRHAAGHSGVLRQLVGQACE